MCAILTLVSQGARKPSVASAIIGRDGEFCQDIYIMRNPSRELRVLERYYVICCILIYEAIELLSQTGTNGYRIIKSEGFNDVMDLLGGTLQKQK